MVASPVRHGGRGSSLWWPCLCSFPVAVTNKLLRTEWLNHRNSPLQSLRPEVHSRCRQGWFLLEPLREDLLCAPAASGGCQPAWHLLTLSALLQSPPPSSHGRLLLSLLRTLVIGFGAHPDNPGSHHKILITSARTPLPHMVTFTSSRWTYLWGTAIQPTTAFWWEGWASEPGRRQL